MVMLGAVVEKTNVVSFESIEKAFGKVFGESKAHLLPINKEALERGAKAVRETSKRINKDDWTISPASSFRVKLFNQLFYGSYPVDQITSFFL